MAGSQVPGSLLRENQTKETAEVRQVLKEVVPGLDESGQFSVSTVETNFNVGFVLLSNAGRNFRGENDDKNVNPRSEEVRQILRKVVPGLADYSFFDSTSPIKLDVGVVHVTLANSTSLQTSSSGVTSSSSVAGNVQTGSSRKVVLESSSQQVESTTSSSNIQVRLPALSSALQI